MGVYTKNLFPLTKASGSGNWEIDDPTEVQHVVNPTEPSLSGSFIFADHKDDGDQVRYDLDQVDLYTSNFNYLAIHVFQDGPPTQQMSVKIRFPTTPYTYVEAFFVGNTYSPEWQTYVVDLGGETYTASQINLLQLWLTAPNPCGEFQIYSVYLEVIGEEDYSQWDADNFIRLGYCSGLRDTHLNGGLIFESGSVFTNAKIRYGDGGLKLGDLQTRVSDGGLILESEIEYSSSIRATGGALAGGSAGVSSIVYEVGTGGAVVGSPSFPNSFKVRVPITVYAGDEAALGVVLGYAVYLPDTYSSYTTYTVEDEDENTLAYEVVNRTGNRISLFVKVNVLTDDRIIYFYAK